MQVIFFCLSYLFQKGGILLLYSKSLKKLKMSWRPQTCASIKMFLNYPINRCY